MYLSQFIFGVSEVINLLFGRQPVATCSVYIQLASKTVTANRKEKQAASLGAAC